MGGASRVIQSHAIALSNFIFKFILKIIAEQLKPIVSHIVSSQQAKYF